MHMSKLAKAVTTKRPTNVSLPSNLVAEAKRLGVNVSQACETGLLDRVRTSQKEEWQRENKEAIESWNKWIAKNGMPFDEFRHP